MACPDPEPWEMARDETLDEMAGQQHYRWEDIQVAVDEMARRWRCVETNTEQPNGEQ